MIKCKSWLIANILSKKNKKHRNTPRPLDNQNLEDIKMKEIGKLYQRKNGDLYFRVSSGLGGEGHIYVIRHYDKCSVNSNFVEVEL